MRLPTCVQGYLPRPLALALGAPLDPRGQFHNAHPRGCMSRHGATRKSDPAPSISLQSACVRPYIQGMTTQLTLNMGALSGIETVKPYELGDVLMHRSFGRIVVLSVVRDVEAAEPEVLMCIKQPTGAECIAFPREILYRSR